ncbi:MAG: PKD domain-containing protein, partial [Bacteroidia bacterium]
CVGPYIADAQNPGSSYLWSTGAGTQTLSISSGGSYSVIVVDALGCQGGDNINIAINPAPIFELGSDTSTCSNQLILTADSGFSAYSWSTGSTTNMDTLLVNDTVYVTVTDTNGCQAIDSLIATINPATIVNLGPDTTQCGGSITLDAQNAGALYFWSNSTSNMTTSVSSSGTYFVNVISQAGCQGSDTIQVTINNQPIVDLGADTAVCQNTITLDAGTPSLNYLWSNSQTTQQVIVGAGTHWVTITDPNGGCSDSDTIQVTTNILPLVTAGSDITICPNQIATLTANGAATYLWSNGDMTQTTQVSPSISTTYYVTGTDLNGCQATDVVNVVVLPSSAASFTHVLLGVTAVFTNTSTNAVTYSWNFGDSSPADNSANPTHTYTVNGTYTVTLTVTGPCGIETFTQVIVISEVGIQDQDLANSLSLYPNPNSGQFTLSFAFESASDVIIDVIDIRGASVYQESLNGITSYNKEISLNNAEAGLYFVRIQTTNGIVTKKIVVQ